MAYTNRNYLEKVKQAVEVTKSHYEPGRQDRCHRWVWQKYIRDMFHIEYNTYLKWLREDPEYTAYLKRLATERAAEMELLKADRAQNPRRARRTPAKRRVRLTP